MQYLNNNSLMYLEEAKVRPVVLTFGRFQPPTVGHQLLITSVINIARKYGAEHRIYPSRTQDAKKNPLSTRDKIRFMRRFFKKANIVDDKDAITVFHVLQKLSDQGYKHVVLVVGSDRVPEFKKAIGKYVGKDGYQFDKFEVVSAGDRDPDAEGVAGMSASKVRASVITNQFDKFKLGMPEGASKKDVDALWTLLRRTMKVQESTSSVDSSDWVNVLMEEHMQEDCDLIERVLSRQARRNIARAAKRTARVRAKKRKIKQKFRKTPEQLEKKAMKQARDLLKAKIAKDVDWNTASISTKERVDKLLAKKKKVIAKVAKKLIPGVRKQEAERIANLKKNLKTEETQLLREPEILDRLVQQLMDKGKSKDAAYAIANAQLQKNGILKKGSTELTDHGKKRNSMTAAERAKDRAAKKDGKSVRDYNYNPRTNTATQKEELDEGVKDIIKKLAKNKKVMNAVTTISSPTKLATTLLSIPVVAELLTSPDRQNQIRIIANGLKSMVGEEVNEKVYADSGLGRWFGKGGKGGTSKGGWDRYDTTGKKIGKCGDSKPGEGKPKCLSKAKADKLRRQGGRKAIANAVKRKKAQDPQTDRPGTGNKPINVSNRIDKDPKKKGIQDSTMKTLKSFMGEENVPTNPSLWSRAKAAARSKFDVYPSAYANAWASKWYKSKGGGWKKKAKKESVDLDAFELVEYRRKDVYAITDKKGKVVAANLTKQNAHKEISRHRDGTIVLDPDAKVGDILKTFAKEDCDCGCGDHEITESEYQGKKVKLNDPFRTSGGPKKFSVYVKNEKGNVVKVNFGDPNMEIKRDDPARRKSFRARHNCDNPGPKWKARYWSCYQWRGGSKVDEERDYKKEYADYHSKPEQRANRSKRVLARRKLESQGRVSKGDGKDVDHKDGNPQNNSPKNLRVMDRSTNRSRNNNKEDYGAGEEGTDSLVKRLRRDTPYA